MEYLLLGLLVGGPLIGLALMGGVLFELCTIVSLLTQIRDELRISNINASFAATKGVRP